MTYSIRLPQEVEHRLDVLSEQTGRSKSFYVKEAIFEHLDNLEDIYLYFNATTDIPYNYTEWFLQYAKSEYASDTLFTDLNGTTHKYCKISVYGQSQDASEMRYILGNQFLKGYYIALNFSEGGHIGFNGNHYRIV